MIPYPFAANDHQTANARAMEKLDAADVVPERDLSIAWLADYIVGGMRNPSRLAKMSAAAKSRAMGNAAEALAEVVVKAGERRDGLVG